MPKKSNALLCAARNAKKDEFYTQLSDIEKELRHYLEHFRGKVVLCNCDDPRVSNFFHYFSHNFEHLGLKKLITICYKNQDADLFSQNKSERAIYLEYTGAKNGNHVPDPDEIGIKYLKGDGDFRSAECIELLKQADIVVTNPPFSLFREYVAQLIEYDKKFLIIGNQNAITYKEIFKLIKENKIWFGLTMNGSNRWFGVPDGYGFNENAKHKVDNKGRHYIFVNGVRWFTNLDYAERHEELLLFKKYSDAEYTKYDNYDAINVDKVSNIPCDYVGAIGVPITFLDKYNPDQFEILGITQRDDIYGLRIKKYTKEDSPRFNDLNARSVIKIGKKYIQQYARIIIRKKKS